MRNFERLVTGIDVSGLRHALLTHPELWNRDTVRTAHPLSTHRVVDDIILRYNAFDPAGDYLDQVCAETRVVTYPAWFDLPQAHPFVYGTMVRVGGLHLGRVMISRVAPGISIPPHTDVIEDAELTFPDRPMPWLYYRRYHVVIDSAPGVQFDCGQESVYMAPGECWWFNNTLMHQVINNSDQDRIHLVMDIRSDHEHYAPPGRVSH